VGDLQIFVLVDLHLVSDAAPILLKSIEEPSSHSVFVVLANDVPAELATIASRCVRVDLSSVPVAAVLDALVAEGISPEQASVAARASGGSVGRPGGMPRPRSMERVRECAAWWTN
jgi:DNA polymerase-3 subunit delta'